MTCISEATTAPDAYLITPPPGAEIFDAYLLQKLEQVRQSRGNSYQPRTNHLQENGWAKHTNRLFLESSPYLLQHAHNPVNWYPWGTKRSKPPKNSTGRFF